MAYEYRKILSQDNVVRLEKDIGADGIFLFTPAWFNPDYLGGSEQNTWLNFKNGNDDLFHISWRKDSTIVLDSRKSSEDWGKHRKVLQNVTLNKRRPTLIVCHHGEGGFQIQFDGRTIAFYKDSINPNANVTHLEYGTSPKGSKGALDSSVPVQIFESLLDFKYSG